MNYFPKIPSEFVSRWDGLLDGLPDEVLAELNPRPEP
jgi:hypothetical protein